MKTSKVTPAKAQTRFWRLVKACIKEFFPDKSASLLSKAEDLRRVVESWSIRKIEHFFHSEPIHVVYDIAGETFFSDEVWDRYVEIRDRDSRERAC